MKDKKNGDRDTKRDKVEEEGGEKESGDVVVQMTASSPLDHSESDSDEDDIPANAVIRSQDGPSGGDIRLSSLPSRTRHSSRRRRETRQEVREAGEQPGPSQDGDVEMRPVGSDLSRKRSSRRSVRGTLKARSRMSVKRGPGESLNITERRTLRREELNQMEQFEIKSLPFCTWLGYKISLSVQRSWQKLGESLKDFRIWGGPIREVEGNLGSGVSTYFRVLRWLLMINTLNVVVALAFITVPGLYIYYGPQDGVHQETTYNADDLNCTNPNFFENLTTTTKVQNYTNLALQFLTGTGWMERTPLYIGWYMSFNITSNNIKYREFGCQPKDRYRCYTFNNKADKNGKRQYDDKQIAMDFEEKDSDYTGKKYDCDVTCPTVVNTSLAATERFDCETKCYECGDYCSDLTVRGVAKFTVTSAYKCFNLVEDATYGAKDCQFPLVDEKESLGLKCDRCRRNGVIYNYALSYVLVGLSFFLLSLLFIIKNMMKLFKKSAVEIAGYHPYSELVFGGWDYNIANKESAILKSKSILKSLKEELTSDDQKEKQVSTKEKVLLVLLRLFTNVVCLGAMGGVFYLYWVVYQEQGGNNPCMSENATSTVVDFNNITINADTINGIWKSYGPAIIVSASNVIFPIFFEFIGNMEMYQFQSTRINITMGRSFLTKLFSVVAYLYILYETIKQTKASTSDTGEVTQPKWTYNCWEDFLGTELYRLIVIDFAVFVIALLTTEWLRRFLVDHNNFIRAKLGITEFNITKEVLDICYKQMIFWSALFFSPLVSVVAFIEIVLMFYFKKISALRNVRPPEKVILNASSSNIINILFIISLMVVFVPIGYIIFTFEPSKSCGPFRNYNSFIEPVNALIAKSGAFKDIILDNLKMTSVVVVIVVVTVIIIYFFYSLSAARQLTIQLLREQIKVENADKKFLIEQMKSNRNPNSSSEVIEDKIVHFEIKSPTAHDRTRTQHNLVWYQSKIRSIPGKDKKKKKKDSETVGSYANPNIRKR